MNLLKPNEGRSKLAIQLIICVLIMNIFSLFSNTLEYQLITSGDITTESAISNDLRQQIIGIAFLAVYIVSIVCFIRWFRRAYYNLHCRAETLNYTEDWASIGWFIPIISFFRPYKITKELFNETDEYLSENLMDYKVNINFNLIGIWWTFWIVSKLFANLSFRLSLSADSYDEFVNASMFNIIADLVAIVTGIFAILVIKEYSKIETLFYITEKKEKIVENSISYHSIEEKKADL